jgi:hypothetical protein
MKKMLFVLLLFIPVALFGQDVEPPASWGDVINNFNGWFATLAGIAAVTVFIASAVTQLFKVTKKLVKQIIAWLIAIALTLLGNLLNIGFMTDFPWLTTLAYGFAAGLVANGFFDVNMVQALLELLKLKVKK